MPRLYNWIRGEGTTKAQRWGLSGYVAPGLPADAGSYFQVLAGVTIAGPGDPNYIDPLLANSTFDQLVPFLNGTNTLGSWIQANGTMLLIGGVALLFLMKRR